MRLATRDPDSAPRAVWKIRRVVPDQILRAVVYGDRPEGYVTREAARPLVSGRRYVADAGGDEQVSFALDELEAGESWDGRRRLSATELVNECEPAYWIAVHYGRAPAPTGPS